MNYVQDGSNPEVVEIIEKAELNDSAGWTAFKASCNTCRDFLDRHGWHNRTILDHHDILKRHGWHNRSFLGHGITAEATEELAYLLQVLLAISSTF